MPSARSLVILCGILAALAGVVALLGLLAPEAADDVMTMETMSKHLDVDRYEDEGRCSFWVTNMSNPTERIEREFACGFFWDWSLRDEQGAYVREALWDHETGAVFRVPHMDRGRMEEHYHVDGHMLTDEALLFQLEAEQDPGVLMPPPGARGNLTMGWVESGGERGGEQRLVHPRSLAEKGTRTLQGLDLVHWNSSFSGEATSWHGYDVHLTEHVDMLSDPQTGWVIEMRRHVKVEMTPNQMADAFGYEIPVDLQAEPEPIMELVYRTQAHAIPQHAEQAVFFQRLMFPIEHGEELARLGGATSALAAVAALASRTISTLLAAPKTGPAA